MAKVILFTVVVIVVGIFIAFLLLRNTEKGKHRFEKVLVYLYAALAMWSICYYFWCLHGTGLSFILLWPAIAVFGAIRIVMLWGEIKDKPLIRIPKWIYRAYRICFGIGLLAFVIIEAMVLQAMNASPKPGLDYVIVLGAQVKGEEPSPTLEKRIIRAAEYMHENPETMLIASGGQGSDEGISEAECIRRVLTEQYDIAKERILLEDQSTSTEENLKFSMNILGKNDATVGIVTNGFHEFRAMMIAEKEGYLDANSVPAETLLPIGIHYTVREFFGIVQFKVMRH